MTDVERLPDGRYQLNIECEDSLVLTFAEIALRNNRTLQRVVSDSLRIGTWFHKESGGGGVSYIEMSPERVILLVTRRMFETVEPYYPDAKITSLSEFLDAPFGGRQLDKP